MKVELFTLCEGAFNHQGRLTIVDTLDKLSASKFPCKFNLGIALKLGFKDETWITDFQMSFKNAEKTLYTFKGKMPDPEEGEGKLSFSANLTGLEFPSAGNYNLDFIIGDEVLASYPFNVLQHEAGK